MGLLSSLGAIVSPVIGGAINSSVAAKKAKNAQYAAIAEARDVLGKSQEDVRGYQAPYLGFGGGATNALSSRLGIAPTGMPASSNALTGQPTAGAPTSPGFGPGVNNYVPTAPGARADDTFIDARTGLAPGASAAPGAAPEVVDRAARDAARTDGAGGTFQPGLGPSTNALSGQPVGAPAAPGVDPGTYGSTANPAYTPPPAYAAPEAPAAYTPGARFSYNVEDYENSPILKFQQGQARNSILSSAGATGALKSGAALKELSDRAQGVGYQFFDKERAFEAGRYDTDRDFDYGVSRDVRGDFVQDRSFGRGTYENDRNFGRDVYGDDRDYLTNRFDTQTNALFRASNQGQSAANALSNAATNYGGEIAGLVTDRGNVKAKNALTQGQIWNDLGSDLMAYFLKGGQADGGQPQHPAL